MNTDRMDRNPTPTPALTGKPSMHVTHCAESDRGDPLSSHGFQDRHTISGHFSRSVDDGKQPIKSGVLQGLLRPLTQSRRRRHDAKTVARNHIVAAMQALQSTENQRKEAHNFLRHFLKHCQDYHLNIEHEMKRASPAAKHPLRQMLDAGDYAGLAILAPALSPADYRWMVVGRRSDSVYVGEGKIYQKDDGEIVSAEGSGVLVFLNGDCKEGQWCKDQLTKGTCYFRAGRVNFHQGTLANGLLDGEVFTKFTNGDTFYGCWKKGDRHGPGILTMTNGTTLRGSWCEGKMLPDARYETREGHIYEGKLDLHTTGKLRGDVTLVFGSGHKCGGRYEGSVENEEPHGMGRYTFAVEEELFGYVYEGPWMDGRKHGSGVLTKMVDGRRYECSFMKDELRTERPPT